MAKKEKPEKQGVKLSLDLTPVKTAVVALADETQVAPINVNRLSTEREFEKTLSSDGEAVTEVATDPRVFERITLGLYREPASAIRELVSNAYDADANTVNVSMNPPYFNRIVAEDDGNGMSAEVVEHLVHHVGGSLKRLERGVGAGVNRSVGVSPGGRRLIGQMGIGIYSVARLTRRFTIETKEKNSNHRFIIDIDLSGLDQEHPKDEAVDRYVAGYARVERKRVHPAEVQKHGTRIILHDILPEARRLLQSEDRWDNYFAKVNLQKKGELKYHIGRTQEPIRDAELPWEAKDKPLVRFTKLVNALSTPTESSLRSPAIDQTLDYYLAMLWKISLSAPLRYLEDHPFSLTTDHGIDFYDMGGNDTPQLVTPPKGVSIGKYLGIVEKGSPPTAFSVIIDGVELRRPIIFRPFDRSADARYLIERPKLFVGEFKSESEGADLALTGYYYWSYDLIPKESNGMLVRIAGSSGTLFDPSFLGFRTSESVRLKQVSAEAFIERGLQQAINVDRESFVQTDPSVIALQRWTERSMTRLFSRLKADQKEASSQRKAADEEKEARDAEEAAKRVWTKHKGKREKPPKVVVSSKQSAAPGTSGDTLFVGGITVEGMKRGGIDKEPVVSARLRAVVMILDAWGLLDELSEAERSSLVNDIAGVMPLK